MVVLQMIAQSAGHIHNVVCDQGNIDQYPASLLPRCKRICNSERFLLHNSIFEINLKRRSYCRFNQQLVKKLQP